MKFCEMVRADMCAAIILSRQAILILLTRAESFAGG